MPRFAVLARVLVSGLAIFSAGLVPLHAQQAPIPIFRYKQGMPSTGGGSIPAPPTTPANNPPEWTTPANVGNIGRGQSYSVTLNATDDDLGDTVTYGTDGGSAPVTAALSGTILTFSVASGAASGRYYVTATASDTKSTVPLQLAVDVGDGPTFDTASNLGLWETNKSNSIQLAASGSGSGLNASSYRIVTPAQGGAGALPFGMSLSTAGLLSGNVSRSSSNSGVRNITVEVADTASPVPNRTRQNFTFTLANAPRNDTNAFGFFNEAFVGDTVSLQMAASDPDSDLDMSNAFSLAPSSLPLPTGVTLNPNGSITGTITHNIASGYRDLNFTIRVTDRAGLYVDRSYTWRIKKNPINWITNANLGRVIAGQDMADNTGRTLSASHDYGATITYHLASGTMPGGVTLSGNRFYGTVSGAAGTYTFEIEAREQNSFPVIAMKRSFTMTVDPTPPAPTSALPDNTYSFGLGSPPSWASAANAGTRTKGTNVGFWSFNANNNADTVIVAGSLPEGLTFSSPGTGGFNITGTISPGAESRTYYFTARAINSYGAFSERTFYFTVP